MGASWRGSLYALLLLSTWAGADTAPPVALQANQLHFISANAEFTLLHEMGHLLINELQLPVLGREEDAADQLGFMGLFLLAERQRDADFYAKLLDVADYWRLEWQRPKRPDEEVYPWDSHGLDAQRFYNIACLAYGSDPEHLEWIISATGLPDERAFDCPEEYQQVAHAVNWLEQHFRRPAATPIQHRIQVIYDQPPPSLPHGEQILAMVRASGELETVAKRASETFALPRGLTLRLTSCGADDAWYNRHSGELTLCYERLAHFQQLAQQLPRLRAGETQQINPAPR
ncbi:MAG: DUF4344 domain-containing metallopeptidase [Pseudomonas sp.]|nr:DUF4344 domain-containing metallopeptidase [Pseudomonas sp.]